MSITLLLQFIYQGFSFGICRNTLRPINLAGNALRFFPQALLFIVDKLKFVWLLTQCNDSVG